VTRVRQEGSLREVRGDTTIGAALETPSTIVVLGVSGGVRAIVWMGCSWRKPLHVLLVMMTAVH